MHSAFATRNGAVLLLSKVVSCCYLSKIWDFLYLIFTSFSLQLLNINSTYFKNSVMLSWNYVSMSKKQAVLEAVWKCCQEMPTLQGLQLRLLSSPPTDCFPQDNCFHMAYLFIHRNSHSVVLCWKPQLSVKI